MPSVVDQNSRSVADIGAKLIKPTVLDAGWTEADIRHEIYSADGRIIVRGKVVSPRRLLDALLAEALAADLPEPREAAE